MTTTTSTTPGPSTGATGTPTEADTDRLNELLGRFVTDLGATITAGNIRIGDRLGLYRGLAEAGPMTSSELADYSGTAERYVREWLAGQAASGYVSYDASSGEFWLDYGQALAFADPAGLVLPGAFQLALASLADEPRIAEAFRSGDGVAWGDHHHDLYVGTERFFRPGYVANLVDAWIPAVAGLDAKLRTGTTVADVGCGLGASTQILARTYPNSTVHGFDPHERSIELARESAEQAGLGDRCQFSVRSAQDLPGRGYGLVATFDSLHDMGDPIAAAAHIRGALAADGIWLIVEPYAGDSLADNLTPVGRMYYGFSTFLCVAHARYEGAAEPLGNQAGEQAVRDVVEQAGFGRIDRVADTPFNIVYAARP